MENEVRQVNHKVVEILTTLEDSKKALLET